jgi:hypothetical protein
VDVTRVASACVIKAAVAAEVAAVVAEVVAVMAVSVAAVAAATAATSKMLAAQENGPKYCSRHTSGIYGHQLRLQSFDILQEDRRGLTLLLINSTKHAGIGRLLGSPLRHTD